jgi:hypothetical protein
MNWSMLPGGRDKRKRERGKKVKIVVDERYCRAPGQVHLAVNKSNKSSGP